MCVSAMFVWNNEKDIMLLAPPPHSDVDEPPTRPTRDALDRRLLQILLQPSSGSSLAVCAFQDTLCRSAVHPLRSFCVTSVTL